MLTLSLASAALIALAWADPEASASEDPSSTTAPEEDEGAPASEADPSPAEEAPVEEPSPVDSEALAAEDPELAAIEAALAADLAAADPAPPLVTPEPASGPLGAVITALNPDMAIIFDMSLAAFSGESPGLLQTGAHDPRVNGFNLQQLELSLGGAVDPYFRFDANLVFSEFGVEVEEAYATSLALPARTQVRLGQFLTRFGRINPTHPHTWAFVDQNLLVGRLFGGEGNRGLGAEVSWLTPLPWYVELVLSETMITSEATDRSWAAFAPQGVSGPLDLQTTLSAKQFFGPAPAWSILWGLNYAVGPNGTGRANRSELYGTDLTLFYRPLRGDGKATAVRVETEWVLRRRQVPGDVLQDLNGYVQSTVRFLPRWDTGVRWELGTPELGGDGEVSELALDPHWISPRQRVSGAVTYRPTEFSRFRLQVARDAADWMVAPGWSAFLAFEANAGAHGAHSF